LPLAGGPISRPARCDFAAVYRGVAAGDPSHRKEEGRKFPIRIRGESVSRRLHLGKQLSRRRGERHPVLAVLLRCGRWLRPYALREVELGPGRAQNLTTPRAGKQQQPNRVGRGLALATST